MDYQVLFKALLISNVSKRFHSLFSAGFYLSPITTFSMDLELSLPI